MIDLPPPRLTTLDNGLRIVSERMPGLASSSLGVFVGAGARVEAGHEHGIAHLLEHMAFKGTRRRSARHIVEEIEAVGGDINAATSMEQTAYYARVLEDDLPLALDILADIVTASVFAPDDLAREKAVIRQEIAAVQDTPDDIVFESLQAAAFTNQPLGRSILGTDRSVAGFTRSDIEGFLRRHYVAGDVVIAAAGAIDHDALVADVTRHFASLPSGQAASLPQARFIGGTVLDRRDLEQVNIALALPSVGVEDDQVHAARIFATLLGGGMSSRLFQEVREKRGLCYNVSAFQWGYAGIGLLGVHAATAPEDVVDLVTVIREETARAAHECTTEEIDRAKAQLRAGLIMSLENSSARADRLARQLLVFGELRDAATVISDLDAVTVDEVHASAQRIIEDGRLALSAIGPESALGGLEAVMPEKPRPQH